MDISELRELVDSDRSYMGLVDPKAMFEWIHPRQITGVDIKEQIERNRSGFGFELNPEINAVDDQFEDDDEYIIEYMGIAVDHRKALSSNSDIQEIPAIKILEALISMKLIFESTISVLSVDRDNLSESDLEECLAAFEAGISVAKWPHVKESLAQSGHFFFCYSYVSPELSTLPEIQKFIAREDIVFRLDALESS